MVVHYTLNICQYIDDMPIIRTRLVVVCEAKRFLESNFDIKDLGGVKVTLQIKITKTFSVLEISEEHYVEKILRKFKHYDCDIVFTLYDPNKENKKHSITQQNYALVAVVKCT